MAARPTPSSSQRAGPPAWLVLAVGIVAVSTSAPIIHLTVAPALALAAWRSLLGGGVYGLAWAAREPRRISLDRPTTVRTLLGAALLAAHFALWIAAFRHTSYANAVLLLVTQPIFAAVLGRAFLREPLTGRMACGVGLAAAGLLLVVWHNLGDPSSLWGDALAVAGSLAYALYFACVRRPRRSVPFRAYMTLIYGVAGVLLTGLCLATGAGMTGFGSDEWALIAALTLVPTVVGHACFNWCVGRVRLFTLNMLIVLEPALALLLGAALFGIVPDPHQLAGGGVLCVAVVVALGGRRRDAGGDATPTEEEL